MVVGDLVLEDLPLAALIEGIRVNPKFADWIFGDQAFGNGNGTFTESPTISDTVPVDRVFSNVLQRIKAPEEISFLLSRWTAALAANSRTKPPTTWRRSAKATASDRSAC